MSQKTIQIDPRYLAASSVGTSQRSAATGTRKRGRKEKPKAATLVKPDKMKKQWIAKVKEFQKKRQDEEAKSQKEDESRADIQEFNDEFSKTMTFFESLATKRQKAKQDRRSRKNKTAPSPVAASLEVNNTPVSLDLPPEFVVDSPVAAAPIKVEPPARPVSTRPVAQAVTAPAPIAPVSPAPVPSALVRSAPALARSAPAPVTSAPVPVAPKPVTSPPIVSVGTVAKENKSPVSVRFPSPALGAQPPYSTLRNGSRPTYRQWRRGQSLKNREEKGISPSDSLTERSIKMARSKLRSTYDKPTVKATPSNRRMKKRITRTIRHRVGRKDGKVGVLIKDAHTRKRVQTEKAQLRRTSIVEVKRFLRSRNLIKAGSTAPNDVLRKMYEQCMLSGDLKNESDEVLLHNFMST
jgi:hypothetical protein